MQGVGGVSLSGGRWEPRSLVKAWRAERWMRSCCSRKARVALWALRLSSAHLVVVSPVESSQQSLPWGKSGGQLVGGCGPVRIDKGGLHTGRQAMLHGYWQVSWVDVEPVVWAGLSAWWWWEKGVVIPWAGWRVGDG